MSNPRRQSAGQAEEMADAMMVEGESSADNAALVEEAAAEEKRIRIVIHNQEGVPGGMDDVFVQVNGKAWLIKRDQEADLPEHVLHALDNAVTGVTNPDGSIRNAKRFNYSVVRGQ